MNEENSGVVQQEEAAPASDLDNIATDEVRDTPAEQEEETQEQPAAEGETADSEPEQHEDQIPNDVWKTARQRAKSEAAKRYDREVMKRCAGKVNPITGKPITTMKEYWDAIDAQENIRHRAAVQKATSGMSAEQAAAIREVIENDPEKARLQSRVDEMERNTARLMADEQLNNDVRELSKLDPSIKSVDDLSRVPEFGEIVSLVQSGATLVNAYKIARYNSAVAQSEQSGRQAAINAARGKNHLAAHGGSVTKGGQKAIPADWLARHRDQFPDKSLDELTKLYNETL